MSSKRPSTGPSRGRPRGGASSARQTSNAGPSSTGKGQKTISSRPRNQISQSPQIIPSGKGDSSPFSDEDIPQSGRRTDIDTEKGKNREERLEEDGDEDLEDEKRTIPPELLTRILHEFFEKDGTRISKDANKAVAKYMDVFVREAIARTAVEKGVGFLEVSLSEVSGCWICTYLYYRA
jgi:centromere protein X